MSRSMADADAAETVGAASACMPVAPPLVFPDVAVPPPMTAAETVATLPPAAADAMEAAVAAMSVVLLPEQMSQSVMGGGEEERLQGEIHKPTESIEDLLSSCADNQNPCDMISYITERNECGQDRKSLPAKQPEVTVQALSHSLGEEQLVMAVSDNGKESEKQIPPPPPCPSDEQQNPKTSLIIDPPDQNESTLLQSEGTTAID